jgi:hypothetical protein
MTTPGVTAEVSRHAGDGCQPELASSQPDQPSSDHSCLAAALAKEVPGSLVWFGHRTQRWWALVMLCGAWTLIDKSTIEEIALMLMPSIATAGWQPQTRKDGLP